MGDQITCPCCGGSGWSLPQAQRTRLEANQREDTSLLVTRVRCVPCGGKGVARVGLVGSIQAVFCSHPERVFSRERKANHSPSCSSFD